VKLPRQFYPPLAIGAAAAMPDTRSWLMPRKAMNGRSPSKTYDTTRWPRWWTPAQPPGLSHCYVPFGDFADAVGCETQFRNSFIMGCAGAWMLHPSQVPIAKRVFSPDPGEVEIAQTLLAAMPEGFGAAKIEGKMQDDATWKQARVLIDLARLVAAKDLDMRGRYRL
jgi:citrate lyase beta subunit